MSFLRPASALRVGLGLGVRPVHTSRVVAAQATKVVRNIGPQETAGFPYTATNAILKGTVNDPTTFPEPNRAHGSYHWAFERLLSAALIPITVGAAVASPTAHPIMDGILGVSILIHSHIGFSACIDDYVHERKFGSLATLCRWLLRFGSAGALYSIYEFNTNDIGLTELIAKVWKA